MRPTITSVLTAALAAGALMVLSACATLTPDRPTVVLVHGAFEDASVWKETRTVLEARGFKTIAVDLPGRPSAGAVTTAPSLDLYRDTVLAAIRAEPRPVILVGHSFGGMTISNVAEAAPEKIQRLVYVAAYLPQDGQALTTLSQRDGESQAGKAFRIDAARGLASIAFEARAGLFCNDCAPAVAAALPAQMVDEPLAPLATPVKLTAARFGAVFKAYIHTNRDLVVSPALQATMVAATPVQRQLTLDTGHAPFLSNPRALANAIADAAL